MTNKSRAVVTADLEAELDSSKWTMARLVKLAKVLQVPSTIGSKSKARYVEKLLKVPIPVREHTVDELITFFVRANEPKPARDSKEALTLKIQQFLPHFKNAKREGFTDQKLWTQYVARCAESVLRNEMNSLGNQSYSFDWFMLERDYEKVLNRNSDKTIEELKERADQLSTDPQFYQTERFQSIFEKVKSYVENSKRRKKTVRFKDC